VIELLVERARRGCAVVLVTHDAALASWADRIVLLRDGRIVDPTNPSADPSARTRTGAPA
jgi:putative ABC transport system ATP-binding protein